MIALAVWEEGGFWYAPHHEFMDTAPEGEEEQGCGNRGTALIIKERSVW